MTGISYNTGSTGFASTATSTTITIPSGVLAGDVMLLNLQLFCETGTQPAVTISGGSAGGWTLVPMASGTNPAVAAGAGIWNYGFAYYKVAAAGDASATLTISESGSAGGTTWFAQNLVSYTGASATAPIDTAASVAIEGGVSTVTCPTLSTGVDADWAVYFGGGGVGSGASITVPSGTTSRQNVVSPGAGIGTATSDGNGSAGSAPASIGGGHFTTSGGGTSWLTAFTIGLSPPSAPVAKPESPVPPQFPHPLWLDLLEVAQQRADWQAQGSASPVRQHWRLMDGAGGRPGNGPGTATGSGSNVNGTLFYTTQGGMWFEGYWWWVAPSGGQSASPQEFALWACQATGTGGHVIPGSVVTSGALSTGWNYVPLLEPVQLSLYNAYAAVTAVSGPHPATTGQFNSGGTYPGGFASGPLVLPSDSGGSNSCPSFGNGLTGAGTDPAQVLPAGNAGNGTNFWLDFQVTNLPPAGYQGTYRLWPNMADGDQLTSADSAVSYVVGTEILTAPGQPAVLRAVWYLVPGGMGSSGNQWATSADVWNVRTGTRIATQQAPVWINGVTGGVDGQSNNPRWVYCTFPGAPIVLPGNGDFYVTVYNGNPTPNMWSAKTLGYWQATTSGANGRGVPSGTYQSTPPGQNGITNGPISAPTTPLASTIQDYVNPSIVEPGQSVFAVGPPNQFPDCYVGTPIAIFQNYWVDAEVQPASTFFAQAPIEPPQVPHQLFWQLLDEARYVTRGNAVSVGGHAALAAAASLGAAALVTEKAAGTLSAPASLAAAARATGVASAHLAGAAVLGAAGARAILAAAALSAPGSLLATARLSRVATSSLAAVPALAATGTAYRIATAHLAAAASLAGAGRVTEIAQGGLHAPGSLTAGATRVTVASSSLAAPGHLTGAAARVAAAQSAMAAPAHLAAGARDIVPAAVHLAASALLTCAGTDIRGPSTAALRAQPALIAAAVTGADPVFLWTAYLAAQQKSHAAWQQWHMMRQAGGTDGSAGFLFGQAYEAQRAAELAYEAWRAAQMAAYPGVTG